MEWQRWPNTKYSKRECIEVVGIANSVNNNELEDKLLSAFQKIGCKISPRELEACHRLRKNNDRVMKFSRRKHCEQIMSINKDLSKNAGYWVNRQSIYIYKYKLMLILPNGVVKM